MELKEGRDAIALWHDTGEPIGNEMFEPKPEPIDIVVQNRLTKIIVEHIKNPLQIPLAF